MTSTFRGRVVSLGHSGALVEYTLGRGRLREVIAALPAARARRPLNLREGDRVEVRLDPLDPQLGARVVRVVVEGA